MNPVVYDAAVLIAADRSTRQTWADHRVRLEAGVVPVVPAPVIAQVSRSPAQVQLRRLLRGSGQTSSPPTGPTSAGCSRPPRRPARSSMPDTATDPAARRRSRPGPDTAPAAARPEPGRHPPF